MVKVNNQICLLCLNKSLNESFMIIPDNEWIKTQINKIQEDNSVIYREKCARIHILSFKCPYELEHLILNQS